MNEPTAVIIGCGPSAMCIAHACHQMGIEFMMYAPRKMSHISGAQYLHTDIGVRTTGIAPGIVTYKHIGTEEGYQRKIYGTLPEGMTTSWDKFHGEVEAWPLIDVYEWLWSEYSYRIIDERVSVERMILWAQYNPECMVFNTAPLNMLLPDELFDYEDVFIMDGVTFAQEDNSIVYNGDVETPWYRTSNLWGHKSIEWPVETYYRHKMPMMAQNPRRIRKPLKTNATIPGVILSGRYGRWQKGVLVDESYHQAIAEIKARL